MIEVRIETLTNMGQGLARVALPGTEESTGGSGWVVLVPFALPGERVRVRIFRNQKNFSEADLVEVVEPSPSRVAPRCAVFGVCGGCQYQQLAYAEQLAWKRRQVAELLRHLAGVEFPVNPVIGSPREYGYRSKITPHFARPKARREAREAGDGDGRESRENRDGEGEQSGDGVAVGAIGFLRAGTRSQLVDVQRCEIATESINRVLAQVRDAVRRDPQRYRQGATLLIREDAEGQVVTDPRAEMVSAVDDATAAGRVRWRFKHLAGDFFQNNPSILPAFVGYIVTAAAESGARYLVDAYGGSGLFAIAAAGRFERVAGVEISATAVAQARQNAAENGVGNATFLAASAEAIFGDIEFPPEQTVVLIDPPRAGCSDDFLRQLVTFRPRCCVYVSCNPATQMRDLRQFLAAGYTVDAVQPFDLFPQTKHLECVLTLKPTGLSPTD